MSILIIILLVVIHHDLGSFHSTDGAIWLSITISCTNKVTSEVINISFHVHKEFFFLTFNLNSLQPLSSQLIRIINIDNVFILFIGLVFFTFNHLLLTHVSSFILFTILETRHKQFLLLREFFLAHHLVH